MGPRNIGGDCIVARPVGLKTVGSSDRESRRLITRGMNRAIDLLPLTSLSVIACRNKNQNSRIHQCADAPAQCIIFIRVDRPRSETDATLRILYCAAWVATRSSPAGTVSVLLTGCSGLARSTMKHPEQFRCIQFRRLRHLRRPPPQTCRVRMDRRCGSLP